MLRKKSTKTVVYNCNREGKEKETSSADESPRNAITLFWLNTRKQVYSFFVFEKCIIPVIQSEVEFSD